MKPTPNRLAIEELGRREPIIQHALALLHYENVGYPEALEIAILQLSQLVAEQRTQLVTAAQKAPPAPAPWAHPDFFKGVSDIDVVGEAFKPILSGLGLGVNLTARTQAFRREAERRGLVSPGLGSPYEAS